MTRQNIIRYWGIAFTDLGYYSTVVYKYTVRSLHAKPVVTCARIVG